MNKVFSLVNFHFLKWNSQVLCSHHFRNFLWEKIFPGLTKFQPQMVSKRPDGSAQCTLCGSVYSSVFTAKTHIIRKHIIPQRFQCRICQAIIEHQLDFSNHIIRKHQVKGCKDILKTYAIPLPYFWKLLPFRKTQNNLKNVFFPYCLKEIIRKY